MGVVVKISEVDIIEALASPKTADQIADFTGFKKRSLRVHLKRLVEQKRITMKLNVRDMRKPVYEIRRFP